MYGPVSNVSLSTFPRIHQVPLELMLNSLPISDLLTVLLGKHSISECEKGKQQFGQVPRKIFGRNKQLGKKKIPWIIWIIIIALWLVIAMIFDIEIPSRWGVSHTEIGLMPHWWQH